MRRGCGGRRFLPGDGRVEQIAVPRHGPDHLSALVAKRLPDIADAARDGFIRHDHVGPDGLDQLLLGDRAPGVVDQVAQHLEALAPQLDRALAPVQGQAVEIEKVGAESQFHPDKAPGRLTPCNFRPNSSSFRTRRTAGDLIWRASQSCHRSFAGFETELQSQAHAKSTIIRRQWVRLRQRRTDQDHLFAKPASAHSGRPALRRPSVTIARCSGSGK
jgi:hypothetical protein